MRTLSLILATLVAAGCTSNGRQPDSVPPATTAPADRSLVEAMLAIQGRMHDRFAATERMHYAIALSDLMRAQREASLVAELDEPDLLPVWRPYVDDIRARARDVIETQDPGAAAHAMAQLGRACARCHLQAKAKLDFAEHPAPPPDPKLQQTMAAHQWATGRMWKGLLAPSDALWNAGARSLADAPLAITAEAGELGIADDVSKIRMLARRAQTTTELDARTELYGELLGTCVRCHATIRDR